MAADGPTHLQEILTGRRPRGKRTPWPVYAVLILAALAGGAYWAKIDLAKTAAGDVTQVVDTSMCEKMLARASDAQPDKFLFCASRRKTIYKITGGHREPMLVMANAVYDLDLDHTTRVEGLSSPDMRYGLDGAYCSRLKPAYQDKTFLLAAPPIDPRSC